MIDRRNNMALSQNPVLRAAGFEALPKSMTFKRTERIGLKPVALSKQEKEKAKICIGYYYYLQTHLENTGLFKEVFKCFYLRNTRRGNWNENDYNLFFNKMFSFVSTGNFINEVNSCAAYFQQSMSKGRFELSFSSKLVHTKNTSCPIFDSGVVAYLEEFEGVRMPNNRAENFATLCTWYDRFVNNDQRYHSWIEWFNETFPEYESISDIKKIDFILFFGK